MRSLRHKISKLRDVSDYNLDDFTARRSKHKLLAEISRRQESRTDQEFYITEKIQLFSLRLVRRIIPREQVVVVALIILIATTSTGLMARAAVPGDILWPVKITIEKAEVALAGDTVYGSRVHLRHVDNRLRELTIIVAKTDKKDQRTNISKLVRILEKDITAANQNLKISKEEKNSKPLVIMELAKDVSKKANEVVLALEENKQVLAAENPVDVIEMVVEAASSTVDVVGAERSEIAAIVLSETGAGTLSADLDAVAKVIDEVKVVHEDVSFSAIGSMIELIEQNKAFNRGEVIEIMNNKITQLMSAYEAPGETVERINNNFLLHRQEARSDLEKGRTLLQEASDLLVIGNLVRPFKKTMTVRELLARVQVIIDEVERAGGLVPLPEPIIEELESIKTDQTDTMVTIQSVGDNASSTMSEMSAGESTLPLIE